MKLVSKVAREGLLVRWAGKKRDRVDEILVRELQVVQNLPNLYHICNFTGGGVSLDRLQQR